MASGTLYTYPENFRAYKAQIAAKYSGANLTVVSSEPEFKFGDTNKTTDFLKKFPLGKVPAFESSDGVKLFESNAIAYYLANDSLRGSSSAVDAAYIQQWINFADSELVPAACNWVLPCMGAMQFNKQATERAREDVKRALSLLDAHLTSRTFLVGERISLADISVACSMLLLFQWVLDDEFLKTFVNAKRWFVTIVNQPEVSAVIGQFKFCTKMAQFDAKAFQALQAQQKGGAPKKEKAEKKEKSKPSPKPTPKPAPEPEEEEDEPAEPPSKDPFAALPKGTFVMDTWKKTYSNKDTLTVALPYFWENFDKENYSVWYCEYDYPDELKLIFMTANLVSGMFQRLDRMRKHAFGSMIIFGENNKNTISGVWIWRGHDLAFTLSPDLQVDYESYTWKKLDYDSEDTKTLIREYFAWEGNFGGKEFNQGKIFK